MMKAKGMAAGGMKKGGVAGGMKKGGVAGGMKAGGEASKGMHKMPDGTMMKDSDMRGMKKGGAAGGMKDGGEMKMVMKDGKKVPSFAADGVGKMRLGGEAKKTGASGARMSNEDAGPAKNKVRGAGAAIRGVRPAMMK